MSPTKQGRKKWWSAKYSEVLYLALIAAVGLTALRVHDKKERQTDTITYSQLIESLEEGGVDSIAIRPGKEIRGTWRVSPEDAQATGQRQFNLRYLAENSDALAMRASEAGAKVTYTSGTDTFEVVRFAFQVLLIGFFAMLLLPMLRQMFELERKVGNTGADTETTFDDVAGTQGAMEELREVVDFLRDPKRYEAVGARPPKGVLMVGPPGTGKTLLARAVAKEAGTNFYALSASELTGIFVGLGVRRVKAVFDRARKEGGIIFIDEIDTLAGTRGRGTSHNEDDRTLNQFLTEMDGFRTTHNVVVIGATNRVDILDPAVLRPGRFDRIISVGLPSAEGRAEILRVHIRKRGAHLAEDVDLDRLVAMTPGRSGAELENLLNEAAMAAAREGATVISRKHFDEASERLFLGRERKGFRPRDEELRIIAVHEIGHAITGLAHVPEEGLHKVTIRPRGEALGVAYFAPVEDQALHDQHHLKGQLIKAMGGRAAEEVVFGKDKVTSGAAGDLEQANRIARAMVMRYGMGGNGGSFLVATDSLPALSPATLREMDLAADRLIQDAYQQAVTTLLSNQDLLTAAADELLDKESLDQREVQEIVERHGGIVKSAISAY